MKRHQMDVEFNAVEAAEKGETAARYLSEFFGIDKREISIKTTVWSDGDYTVRAMKNYPMTLQSGKFTEQCIYSTAGPPSNKPQFVLSVTYNPFTPEGTYKEPRTYRLDTR